MVKPEPGSADTPRVIGDGFPALLCDLQAGDERAFATLWPTIQPALLRYLRVVVHTAAEDVASETWARIARDIGRFEGSEADFRAWVFTIARHRALDWRRYEARRPSDPHPDDVLADRAATDDTAAAALEADSLDAALALISTLPPDQAEVVMLRAVAGLDVASVASILGKRPGAVRALAHRGLRRLARQVEAEDTRPGRVTR